MVQTLRRLRPPSTKPELGGANGHDGDLILLRESGADNYEYTSRTIRLWSRLNRGTKMRRLVGNVVTGASVVAGLLFVVPVDHILSWSSLAAVVTICFGSTVGETISYFRHPVM